MAKHLSAVAAGSTQTDIAAHIRLMGHFFEQGVPADDDTCVRMMRAFPRSDCIEVDITEDFFVILDLLPAGELRDDDRYFNIAYSACDAYGEDEKALSANFYKQGLGCRLVGAIHARATPDGFRQFIRDVRTAARSLKDKGLCPKCPDPAKAIMRIPRAKYCAKCCFAVAILGECALSGEHQR